jgi:predicted ribosome quality control (RQC) complex YloA/Tae2 family protein
MKDFSIDGYAVKIGQNRDENEKLLYYMNANFTWFHVKDYPSAHLWIEEDFNNLTKKQIYKCALELKKSGKYRKWNNIEIIYTLGKNLKKTNTPGTVITNKTKTIKV